MARARQKQHSTKVAPIQVWETNTKTTPINHQRTIRRETVSTVTSSFAGKLVPLRCIPLLREDGITNGQITVNVQMAETVQMLLNPVRVSVAAYLVPKLAFERFKDMGQIDRSYNGINEDTGAPIPWFDTFTPTPAPLGANIFKTLGLHYLAGEEYNTDYVEAYNAVWNYIAVNRSPSLTPVDKLNVDAQPAFWPNTQMKHVVPTFDQALMDGEVPVVFQAGGNHLPVVSQNGTGTNNTLNVNSGSDPANQISIYGQANTYLTAVLDELTSSSFSLADIDQARETAAWARMRTHYQGKSEEWMIDQLLQGMRLNDDALKQPILLDTGETVVGMAQRYATDAGNLEKSVTDGQTSVQLRLRTPSVQCGGIVVIVAQALPEQLYENQEDVYFSAKTVADLPNRTSDELDPQPVELVKNRFVSTASSTPEDLFGYAPLNHRWQRNAPAVGGKYYRDNPDDPWTEDRNRIWDSAVASPALGPDWYTSQTIHHQVFADSNNEPFEWWVSGEVNISGLTYFGPQLRESVDDYDKVIAQVDSTRLAGDGTDVPT